MALIGYGRVSATDQDLTVQEEKLKAAGASIICMEKASGATAQRAELQRVLLFIRQGDVLVATRIDRLARSLSDLLGIVKELKGKGAGLRFIDQPFDTTTPHGELMISVLGAFAQFETALRRERQQEGIEKAKARGAYKGRPRQVSVEEVRQRLANGEKSKDIARDLGCSQMTIYRAAR